MGRIIKSIVIFCLLCLLLPGCQNDAGLDETVDSSQEEPPEYDFELYDIDI